MTSVNSTAEPRRITRRRLVRTTATVAWTVPMIQIAATAPAFAGTGCCDISLTGSARWRTGGLNYLDIPLSVVNGCSTAVTGLSVTLTICGIQDLTYSDTTNLPAGWTQLGKGNKHLDPDGNGCYTFTFMTAAPLAGNSSVAPVFTVKTMAYIGTGNHRPAGMITAQVSSSSCSSTAVVIAVPQVG
ncbi:hypothetical protein [Nocardioides cynanchi]|uniref:hypothetical protein n=1 Tax=Nocardioides cynanchi TaxID=2558918 RepID=UPI00124513A9|nr:hypothetical protein [Nocardioides cynanchi]